MFDSGAAPLGEPLTESTAYGYRPPGWTAEDEAALRELDRELDRKLEEALGPLGPVAEDEPFPPPEDPGWRSAEQHLPSGWTVWGLDADTTDVHALTDAELVDATIGWGKTAAWAQARQARVLAEFARRRPGDDPTLVTGGTCRPGWPRSPPTRSAWRCGSRG
jgi:hypothetical protein